MARALTREELAELDKKLSQGNKNKFFIKAKELEFGEHLFRFLPLPAKLNGLFYMEITRWWIDKKPYVSYATFGKSCPIQEEIDAAAESGDRGLEKLLADNKRINVETVYWLACLKLEEKESQEGKLRLSVVDGRPKIFEFGKGLLGKINKNCMMNRQVANIESDAGLFDQKEGFLIEVAKTKKGDRKQDVDYNATLAGQKPMPDKYYEEIVDTWAIAEGQLKSKKLQRAAIREYLYGEEIPDHLLKAEEERVEERKAEFKKMLEEKQKDSESSKSTRKPKPKPVADDEDEDDEEDVRVIKKTAKKKSVPLEDDDDDEVITKKSSKKKPASRDLDDDDIDERPTKKTAKKKPVMEDDDDDFETDIDEALEKGAAKSKKAVKGKKVEVDEDDDDIDDIDDLDDEDDEVIPVNKKKSAVKKSAPAGKRRLSQDINDDLDD